MNCSMRLRGSRFGIFCCSLIVWILFAGVAYGSTAALADYHRRVAEAEAALDRLKSSYRSSDMWSEPRIAATIAQTRDNLPAKESIVANGTTVDVDNAWLHGELNERTKMTIKPGSRKSCGGLNTNRKQKKAARLRDCGCASSAGWPACCAKSSRR